MLQLKQLFARTLIRHLITMMYTAVWIDTMGNHLRRSKQAKQPFIRLSSKVTSDIEPLSQYASQC